MKSHCTFALLLALSTCSSTQLFAEGASPAAGKDEIEAPKVSDPAPEFKVSQSLKGEPFVIDEKGTFIVESWATWCGPCTAAFPHLIEVAQTYKDKISWIGPPSALKPDLLGSILYSTFDSAAFAQQKDQYAAAAKYYGQHVMPLIRKKDASGAIAALEKNEVEIPDQSEAHRSPNPTTQESGAEVKTLRITCEARTANPDR